MATVKELKKIITNNNIELLKEELNNKNLHLSKEDFNELLQFSCEKNEKDIIQLFFKDKRFSFTIDEKPSSKIIFSAFKSACFYSSYEIVELFLKRNETILINEEVLKSAAGNMLDDYRALKKLLEISKKQNNAININHVLIDQASTPYLEPIEMLFQDERVNPNTNENDFFLTFLLLYDGNAIIEDRVVFEFILNDSRFSFIPYTIEEFENVHKKIKNDKFALYKFLFSIPELKKSLVLYLDNNIKTFPEWQPYLDFIYLLIQQEKIRDF